MWPFDGYPVCMPSFGFYQSRGSKCVQMCPNVRQRLAQEEAKMAEQREKSKEKKARTRRKGRGLFGSRPDLGASH